VADDDQSAFDDPLSKLLREYAKASPDDRPPLVKPLIERIRPTVVAAWRAASLDQAGVERQDFLQDVFAEVFEKLHRLPRPATFSAFLGPIVQRLAEKAWQDHVERVPTVDLRQAKDLSIRIDRAITAGIEYDSLIQQLPAAERGFLEKEIEGLDPLEFLERLNQRGAGNSAFGRVISSLREQMKRNARRLRKIIDERRQKGS
jgi:DNA-directed RNA polymerase specialized sigma24 family protein